jgi:hypothetical protein
MLDRTVKGGRIADTPFLIANPTYSSENIREFSASPVKDVYWALASLDIPPLEGVNGMSTIRWPISLSYYEFTRYNASSITMHFIRL